jgi:ubiquinone/menaquinone biosynthesis C-methylase UbiE
MTQVGKFTQPDHSGNPRYFIEFLEFIDCVPEMTEVRARSLSQMRIQPGACVLDVGCGIGTAVGEMADRVGHKGAAWGVDISEAMIAEATARTQGRTNVEFSIGGAYALPHADAMFDAVRMERVLLYVPDRAKAITEMMRVTKPGGRVVITDVDVDCTAIAGKDRALTRKMTSLLADSFTHPTSGRELPALIRAAGLEDVTVDFRVVRTPYEFCLYITQGTLQAAAEAGKVTVAEVEEWYRGLAELELASGFIQLWFCVIAGGTVPCNQRA